MTQIKNVLTLTEEMFLVIMSSTRKFVLTSGTLLNSKHSYS